MELVNKSTGDAWKTSKPATASVYSSVFLRVVSLEARSSTGNEQLLVWTKASTVCVTPKVTQQKGRPFVLHSLPLPNRSCGCTGLAFVSGRVATYGIESEPSGQKDINRNGFEVWIHKTSLTGKPWS